MLSGYFGITKIIAKLKTKYYWPTMLKDTIEFIKTCHYFQVVIKAVGKEHGFLQQIPLENIQSMTHKTVDFSGKLPSTNGKKYIIVRTCNASKMVYKFYLHVCFC